LRRLKNNQFRILIMPILRILLLPFAFLYTAITDFRNLLYDSGIIESNKFDRFVIGVGNLTAGGTGKTPFVELILRELKPKYKLAVLSRGYKRKTKGFRLAGSEDNSETLGDEPFQYYSKFGSEITVAVAERRALAIPKIISKNKNTEVIILDDAFQHRSVIPDLNILLNDYNRPFYIDKVIPTGFLRESRKHAKRADVVVVTKCPAMLSKPEMAEIKKRIQKYSGAKVPIYFTSVTYLQPVPVFGEARFSQNVMLFSGIADAGPLENYVKSQYNLFNHKRFPDHYTFTKKDIKELAEAFDSSEFATKCLLTTEKDIMRLLSMEESKLLINYPVFYLPIELYFLDRGDFFADYLNREAAAGLKAVGHL
jgi:tetraacyldisaccharide 4'-kinase